MSAKTIFDVYSDFQADNLKVNKSTLRSIIHRFLAESWGGEAPQTKKATSEEIIKLLGLMKTLPAAILVNSLDILEQKFIQNGTDKNNSK